MSLDRGASASSGNDVESSDFSVNILCLDADRTVEGPSISEELSFIKWDAEYKLVGIGKVG